jgi:predicted nucleotidyltransferase
MGMDSEREALRDLISPLFEGASGGPYTVYLYGSRATGGARADSDYDFALIAPAPLDRGQLGRFRDSLADILPGDAGVDCVDMRKIPLTLAAQVLESGIVLLPGDEGERARLETRLMSMYAALNEERAGILEDIVERGSVYAR